MTTAPTANDLIMGGGAPSASFLTIGTTHVGVITMSEVNQQKEPGGTPKVWADGNPMMQAVITIQTTERDLDRPDDDGLRRIFAKGQMLAAIREAVRKVGASGIEVGGTLAIQYASNGAVSTPGFNPPKQYIAEYQVPSPTAATNSLISAEPMTAETYLAEPDQPPATAPVAAGSLIPG